jgi:hypothetical protein
MFCLGAWLTGTVCVAVVATGNFGTVDWLLDQSTHPVFRAVVDDLGRAGSRDFMRYLSSELNRLYFQIWNAAQVVLGVIVLWLASGLPDARRERWGVILMLAVVGVMVAWLTPQILTVGRALDFVPRDPPPPALGTFGLLHAGYVGLDLVKLFVGVLVTIGIARPKMGTVPIS